MVQATWQRFRALIFLALLPACGGASASLESPMAPSGVPGAARERAPFGDDDMANAMMDRASGGAAAPPMLAQAPDPAPQASPISPPTGPGKAPEGGRGETASDVAAVQGPMLIYTAQIVMAVFEVKKALAEVEDLGRELGGFLAKRTDNTITVRVPVRRFDEAVKRLEKMGDMVQRNVTAEDVTEEFRDLEVRLRSARAVRDRLEQLLAKAAKVEESVLIERELERVTGEIERVEGRLKFLRDRASYSTITVTFQPHRAERPRKFNLPVPWLDQLGLGRLLNL